MADKNVRLKEKGLALMIVEELIGARLYTGPLFEKYNTCAPRLALSITRGERVHKHVTNLSLVAECCVRCQRLTLQLRS